MTIKKGFLSLVDNEPNFSNQAIENAVNTLKIGWVQKGYELDYAIANNSVLTSSQKNDLKDDIDNVSYLNLGRTLGDLVRHTASIIDATIIPVPENETQQETFLSILQNVQSVQSLVPNVYGVSASDKQRSVDDHLGTLNNIFSNTTDSSAPVFTSLLNSINFISSANLATETALETAYDNLKNFLAGIVADSTDFQTTLDNFATAVATAHTNFNTALASEPYLTHRNNLASQREKINVQVSLENSNLAGLSDYIETLSNNLSYSDLANDPSLRKLMSNVAQNTQWQTYFNDYETNQSNINPIYDINTDSDKSAVINRVLADSGLPDVLDYLDLQAVANKSKRDARIDTANYDRYSVEQQIIKSCQQLGIVTANRGINSLSNSLLNNMNKFDRDEVARRLDLNESSNTLS
jgi:hypothetical protein